MWGAEVKESDGKVLVKHEGIWADVATLGLSPAKVREYHRYLYRTEEIPKRWVFNDFGHITCFLYRDLNKNGQRDAKERVHGEFIHPTPFDEAAVRKGLDVKLVESHGCIHVKPTDIDDMIKRGFLAKNRVVVVHRYSETVVGFKRSRHAVGGPLEVHFYPGAAKLCVVGVSKF